MKDIIKNLLVMGATIGLSDREAFIEKVSGIITQYQADPARADEWAQTIAAYLERSRDDLRLQQVIENAMQGGNTPDKENIEELTRAVKELTRAIQQKKD